MATDQAPAQLVLGREDHGRLVSAEEFANAEFQAPWKYERANGRLIVLDNDGQMHIDGTEPWMDHLYGYKLAHRDRVRSVLSNAWVRVDEGTDRFGDIGVYLVRDGSAPKIPDRVPELIFEIVSPGKAAHERDYVVKREEYHRLGVREYVIVEARAGKVTVLTHAPDGYVETVLSASDTYATPLLPGLAIRLADVFA